MTASIRKIDYGKEFDKQLKKAPLEIKIAFRERLDLFVKDRFYPLLKNHLLFGNYAGFRSINVTGDWRAIYFEEGGTATFVALGTHSQLYK